MIKIIQYLKGSFNNNRPHVDLCAAFLDKRPQWDVGTSQRLVSTAQVDLLLT